METDAVMQQSLYRDHFTGIDFDTKSVCLWMKNVDFSNRQRLKVR